MGLRKGKEVKGASRSMEMRMYFVVAGLVLEMEAEIEKVGAGRASGFVRCTPASLMVVLG
jgi:hypothetical protein